MPIKINSTGGGSVSIDVPSTGGTYTLTAPANNATIFTTAGGAITGNVAFTSNNVSIGGNYISSYTGIKNRIINGDMRIDQRRSGSSYIANTSLNGVYSVDRFKGGAGFETFSVSPNLTVQRVTGPTDLGFLNALKLTVTTAGTFGANTDSYLCGHHIESMNLTDFAYGTASAKTSTLSFWVRSSLAGQYSMFIYQPNGNRMFLPTYNIDSSNVWQRVSIIIPGDTVQAMSSTIGDEGMRVEWRPSGSGIRAGAATSTWTALDDRRCVTGNANFYGTLNATFELTGVQLEIGNFATPFELRPYSMELALCQRYYSIPLSNNTVDIYRSSGSSATAAIFFKTSMRTSPTLTYTLWSTNYGSINTGAGSGGLDAANITSDGFALFIYTNSVPAQVSGVVTVKASAEL